MSEVSAIPDSLLELVTGVKSKVGEKDLVLVYGPDSPSLELRVVMRVDRIWPEDPCVLVTDGGSMIRSCRTKDVFPINFQDLNEFSGESGNWLGAELVQPTSIQHGILTPQLVILHPHRSVEVGASGSSWTPSGNKQAFIGRIGIRETDASSEGKYIVTLWNDNLSFSMTADEFSHVKFRA